MTQDAPQLLDESLAGHTEAVWLSNFEEIMDDLGYFQPLSARHCAGFIDGNKTLLVSFETLPVIQTKNQNAHPVGFSFAKQQGWSVLSMISMSHTWFRDPSVYRYFDRLIDDGFFEDFDRVIFFGAGPCGYAASAFSVAAPGAQVLALSPQATLDPRVTEWDDRFRKMRRVNFNDRYGYAPDMLDAAAQAWIVYDPTVELDAMHAALFTRSNVEKLRMPLFGTALSTQMTRLGMLTPILLAMGEERFTQHDFHSLFRARRRDRTYLRALLDVAEDAKRWDLALRVCSHTANELNAPRFRNRMNKIIELQRKEKEGKAAD